MGSCFHKHQSQTHPTPHRRRAPRLTEADPEDGAGAFSAAQGHQGASASLLRPWGVWGASPHICSFLLPLWGNACLWIFPLFSFIEVWLIYNAVLISSVRQRGSVRRLDTCFKRILSHYAFS